MNTQFKLFVKSDDDQCEGIENDFGTWMKENILRPIQGFEHMKNADGTYYTYDQQMRATYWQMFAIIRHFLKRGKSYDEIISILTLFR